tara:strand:- start:4707 stop:5168 length:462 start_codon:yes stop_codon:yes gene_type:complete
MAFNLPTFLFQDTLTASAMSSVASCFQAFADGETGSPFMPSRAHAIVNYDSSGINFSHNISSVTRTSQGQYTITFSSICSLFVVDSVSVPSLYALGNAHDTTNENALVVYSMYFHTETASSFKVVHHNFRESSHGFHDPVSATAVFFNTDVSS